MKYLLPFLITTFFFALTYQSAPAEFLSIDLILIGFLLTIVVGVECFIAHLVARYRLSQDLVLAGATVFNILFLNLVLNEGFITLPRYGQVLALLIGGYVILTLIDMMDRSKRVAIILPSLVAVATVGVVIAAINELTPTIKDVAREPGKTSSENIRMINFSRKPNIYFVGLDSLIPKTLLRKYVGLENTAYHTVLDKNFRRFENFFADRIPSKPSLNSLLALDIDTFDRMQESESRFNYFVGLSPSPLLEIFKQNGYETTTFYRGYYFGKTKGPYVDNYQFANTGNSRLATWLDSTEGACEFIRADGIRVFTFLGYCYLAQTEMFKGWVFESEGDDQIDLLIRHMRNGLNKQLPQIFVSYLYSPGHTPHEFNPETDQDRKDYREYYLKESVLAASYLTKLIKFIREEDPDAILYVFGDHGPYMSRYVNVENNSTFVIQDRYGVYGGIFPKDRCKDTMKPQDGAEFMTVAMGARGILRCLSDKKDAFVTIPRYRLPAMALGISRNYEDYLYD